MNSNQRWQKHLNHLVSASLDPLVYALQWARDPRCLQSGAGHRRVGQVQVSAPVCSLWATQSKRTWE